MFGAFNELRDSATEDKQRCGKDEQVRGTHGCGVDSSRSSKNVKDQLNQLFFWDGSHNFSMKESPADISRFIEHSSGDFRDKLTLFSSILDRRNAWCGAPS